MIRLVSRPVILALLVVGLVYMVVAPTHGWPTIYGLAMSLVVANTLAGWLEPTMSKSRPARSGVFRTAAVDGAALISSLLLMVGVLIDRNIIRPPAFSAALPIVTLIAVGALVILPQIYALLRVRLGMQRSRDS